MESRKNGTDEPISREGVESQMYRTDMWTQEGKGSVGPSGSLGLMYVHRHV